MTKIGFTCGAFDLFHAGHVAMLRECANQCDVLVVGLHTNPKTDRPEKNSPVQSMYERYLQLQACQYVHKIIPYDSEKDLVNLLAIEKIDVRFLSEEYIGKSITGEHICDSRCIDIIYNIRRHSYSSSELRNRISG
jgi:glycerol-3-phosphate cytidylyltransferase